MHKIPLVCLWLVVVAACSKPERQLESGRQYTSIVYADTEYETFGRTDRSITGTVVTRYSDTIQFLIHTRSDASVSAVDLTLHAASRRGRSAAKHRFKMPSGTLPIFGNSVAFLEQVLRRARVLGGDSVRVPVMFVGTDPSEGEFTVIQNGSDSVLFVPSVGHLSSALRLAVDSLGHITGGGIPVSGMQILVGGP